MRGASRTLAENIDWLHGDNHIIWLPERPTLIIGAGSGTPLHVCRTSQVCIYLLNTALDSCLQERDMVFATIYSVVICSVRLEDSCLQERDMVFATIL